MTHGDKNVAKHLAGEARGNPQGSIPWLVGKDSQLVVHCSDDGKKVVPLALAIHKGVQHTGVTELNMADHDLQPMTQDRTVIMFILSQ